MEAGLTSRRLVPITFLGVGSQKCASTWLDGALREHPEVQLPQKKELNYFSRHILTRDLAWYRRQFEPPRPEAVAVGEISPSYARMDGRLVRMLAQVAPELRIVLLMRDPVERAWSQLVFEITRLRRERLEQWSMPRMVRYLEHVRNRRYGDYGAILDRWEEAFGAVRVWAQTTDEIQADPLGVVRRVARHIGVDPAWSPQAEALAPTFAIESLTGQPKPPMPRLIGWYLARQWLEPTRRLNDRLDGRVASWVDRMEQLAQAGAGHWPVLRALNRRLAAAPERAAYATHEAVLGWRLRRRYTQLALAQRQSSPEAAPA